MMIYLLINNADDQILAAFESLNDARKVADTFNPWQVDIHMFVLNKNVPDLKPSEAYFFDDTKVTVVDMTEHSHVQSEGT